MLFVQLRICLEEWNAKIHLGFLDTNGSINLGQMTRSYYHHHHHVVPLARISLTLSRHFSLSFIASGRSSWLHPVSSHSCCMYVRAGRPDFAWPYAGVHWSRNSLNMPGRKITRTRYLDMLLPGHMWGSIGVHHLWAHPCFSSSVLYVWFV